MLKAFRRFFVMLGTLFAASIVLGSVGALFLTYYFMRDLPDYHQLAQYNPATLSRLYAADGRLMAEYAKEKRLFVPVPAIPKKVINAFIAAEDKNFYSHPGIDIVSIGRAATQNLMNLGQNRPLVGGSTITQQVVKNFLLTKEQSFDRKVKEAILSFRITQAFSKDRILELYLNEIYLGSSSYGVAAAALNYFNKSVDELTYEEAALLAGMPKAPGSYDPVRNYDRALQRRNYVLGRMYEDNYITKDEYKKAIVTPITLRKRDETELVRAAFFAETVRRQLATIYGEKELYEGGLTVRTTLDSHYQEIAARALRKGLIAYDRRHRSTWDGPITDITIGNNWQAALRNVPTPSWIGDWRKGLVLAVNDNTATIGLTDGSQGTISLESMKWARRKLSNGKRRETVTKASDVLQRGEVIAVEKTEGEGSNYTLQRVPDVNGGLIAIDPHTGRVVAMMGGFDGEESQFNRAIQAKRQPGSAFKPFVYMAAIEQGFTPSNIIVDAEIELSQGPGLPTWKPSNYSHEFYGPSTLRTGVERSRNAMTVRLALMIGIDRVLEICKRFGIDDNPPRNFSIVLGAAETTLIDMTTAYAMLVNGGKRVIPSLIERVQDRNGKTIFRRDERPCQDCITATTTTSESSAEEGNTIPAVVTQASSVPPVITDIREAITDPESAYQMVSILEGVVQRGTGMEANKLGRTLGGKTGTTNDSYDTWFIGFSPDLVVGTYIGFDNPRTLGAKETGASVALPVFIDFMENALKDKPDIPFRIPPGIQLVRVDHNTGLLPTPGTPESDIILEAFKPGTAPTSSSSLTAYSGEDGDAQIVVPETAPTVGTGGLY